MKTQLNARELLIVRGVAKGKTLKMLAREIGISPETMRDWSLRVRLKLGADTIPQAVANAARMGFLDKQDA